MCSSLTIRSQDIVRRANLSSLLQLESFMTADMLNKTFLLPAILIAIVAIVFATPVSWTWENLREKEMELEGRAGVKVKVEESSKFCQDATQCKSRKFYYDLSTMHCYKTRNLASGQSSKVKYRDYNPTSPSVSTCVNLGGEAVMGGYGYMFQKDEVSSADYFNIDTEEDYKFSVGETLSTNEPISKAGKYQKVYQSASLLFQGEHFLHFPGSEYYLLQMFFALIDHEDSSPTFGIKLEGRDGTFLELRRRLNVYNSAKSYTGLYINANLEGKQGTQLVYKGKTINLNEKSMAQLTLNSTDKVYMNGYCLIRYHKCNQFCSNPEQCNKLKGCNYDKKKSHCVQK